MRKVYLQCEICGQKMKVSRSAIGKKGACPRCGLTIRITAENTSPFPPSRWERPLGAQAGPSNFRAQRTDHMGLPGPSEEAKQRFSMGVDLFCNGRYEEALTVFNALARLYPGNPDIESARAQCIKAMQQKPITLPGPDETPGAAGVNADSTKPRDLNTVRTAMLDTLMEKMQQGKTEAIQLQAVELLLQLLPRLEQDAADLASRKMADRRPDAASDRNDMEDRGADTDALRATEARTDTPDHLQNSPGYGAGAGDSVYNKATPSPGTAPAQDENADVVHGYADVYDAVATPELRAKKRA